MTRPRPRRGLLGTLSDHTARRVFQAGLGLGCLWLYVVGRRQWFIRDDWAFVLLRESMRRKDGWQKWLFVAQDGHWMTPPILLYRAVQATFGIGSYWPFLVLVMAMHVGIVLLARELCRRCGASEWTTTLLCLMLLVFGGGWENVVFAIQITYNLSLLCFLAQVLLADHTGPPDRRDAAGSALGLVGVMSSGFGPFFVFGIAVLLLLRRRWTAALVAAGPPALAFVWWWARWGRDPAADSVPQPVRDVPEFVARGLLATFESITVFRVFALIAGVAAVIVVVRAARRSLPSTGSLLVALCATAGAMFAGIGLQRVGFGIEGATASRYQYMAAMLLAPVIALSFDRLRSLPPPALLLGRVLLLTSLIVNAHDLRVAGDEWADQARSQQYAFALIAGSGLAAQADPEHVPMPFSPDVKVRSIALLAAEGAIDPRPPADAAEVAWVRCLLGLDPPTVDSGVPGSSAARSPCP